MGSRPRAGATSVAINSIDRSSSSCGGSTGCDWKTRSLAPEQNVISLEFRVRDLLRRATWMSNSARSSAWLAPAGTSRPERFRGRQGTFDATPDEAIGRGLVIHDDEVPRAEHPRFHAVGKRGAVRVDEGALRIGEGREPAPAVWGCVFESMSPNPASPMRAAPSAEKVACQIVSIRPGAAG